MNETTPAWSKAPIIYVPVQLFALGFATTLVPDIALPADLNTTVGLVLITSDDVKERVTKLNTPDYPVSKDVWSLDFTEYVAGQSGAPVEIATKAEPKKKASWI